MLNRRRRNQTPTFLEGTPGLYVKRESPPRVPSTAPIPTKSDVNAAGSSLNGGSNASRSLSSSRSSLLQQQQLTTNPANGKKARQLMGGACGNSTPSLVTSALHASAASIATTNMGGGGSYHREISSGGGRRLSHTPIRPQRKAAARHELSSHSFNNPPSSSWTSVSGFPAANRSAMALNSVNVNSSSGRPLGTSLSFGNMADSMGVTLTGVDAASNPQRPPLRQKTSVSSGSGILAAANGRPSNNCDNSTSVSLQTLPGSSILHDSTVNQNSVNTDSESDLPLPPNWEVEVTADGIRYYVDHDHQRTHWIHPLAVEHLTPGWIKIFDHVHGVVYYNEIEQCSQFEHPGLATVPAVSQFASSSSTLHDSGRQSSTYHHHSQIVEECGGGGEASKPPTNLIEDLNIINSEAVPEWIRLYSEAPFESDHLLNWEMFHLAQLEDFDHMLMKLFKQDAINTVIKYERPRREINNELARRISVSH